MAEAQVSTSLVAAPSLATQIPQVSVAQVPQTFPAQNVQNIPQIGPSGQNLSQNTSSVLWTILSAAGILALIMAMLVFILNMIKPQALPVWIPLPHARERPLGDTEEAEEAADSDASDGEEAQQQQKKPRKRPAQNKGKGPAAKKEEKKEESGAEAEPEVNTGLFTEFPDAAA